MDTWNDIRKLLVTIATKNCFNPSTLHSLHNFTIDIHTTRLPFPSSWMTMSLKKLFTEYLKWDSHLPKKICFIYFNESPLKMIKNAFYFILRALFVLKIFKFLSWLSGHVEKTGLVRNMGWTSKFMTSQSASQTIAIHILHNISWSKTNQTIKFGQLIEYNKRNVFLQKSGRKWGG